MPSPWVPLPINSKWFANVAETALTRGHAALENCYMTETGAVMRFPGLKTFANLGGEGERIYLHEHRGDLIAATSFGRLFRIGREGRIQQIPGAAISGGRRVVFAATDESLLMAAGGPIIVYDGEKARQLSDQAPFASHVQVVDAFVLANDMDTNFFMHSKPGAYDQWDDLSIFAAVGNPDPVNAILVTPFREVLVCGERSVEQYDRLQSGDPPFFRRWASGEGVFAPYTLCFAGDGVWFVNAQREFVRLVSQTGRQASGDIGRVLEGVDDWRDAWAAPLEGFGQKFILLSAPHATTPYEGKGLTLLLDYRQGRWSALYGWDDAKGQPKAWPGWSIHSIWGRHFVGGGGVVYELTEDSFFHADTPARMRVRTAHYSDLGESRINAVRMRFRRGLAPSGEVPSQIRIRANRDNKGMGNWSRRNFGGFGQREMTLEWGNFGCAHTWQFEIDVMDDCTVELVRFDLQATKLGE